MCDAVPLHIPAGSKEGAGPVGSDPAWESSCGGWEGALDPKMCCWGCWEWGIGSPGGGTPKNPCSSPSPVGDEMFGSGLGKQLRLTGGQPRGHTDTWVPSISKHRHPALISSTPDPPSSPSGTRPELPSASPIHFKGRAGMKGPLDHTTLIPASSSSFPGLGNIRVTNYRPRSL